MSLVWTLLAAGESKRLGQPKQLVFVNGEPLIRRQCRVMLEADVGRVQVVVGAHSERCREAIAGMDVNVVENPEYAGGMGTSIAAGARNLSGAMGIVLVDQWKLTAADLRTLHDFWKLDPTTCCASESGPPVIIPSRLVPELLKTPSTAGAKWLLNREESRTRHIQMENASSDLDTPDDLSRL